MKRLPLLILACLATSPAFAIDCTKAASETEKLICGDARLKKADAAMGKAYQAFLATAPDDEIRAAMVDSQKRWLEARDKRSGPRDDDDTPPADIVLDVIEGRTVELAQRDKGVPGFVAQALKQRAFAAKFSGGPFAGYSTSCDVFPPDNGYFCFATRYYQNGARICSVDDSWATGSVYVRRTVADVVDGTPKLKASCGFNTNDNECPGSIAEDARWNTEPKQDAIQFTIAPLPKVDGDIEDGDDYAWLNECLTEPDFPAAP